MNKLFALAAVGGLALSLGACKTTGNEQAAIEAILANPANVNPAQIQSAIEAASPSLAAKIEAVAAQAQKLAVVACGVQPLASSLASIAAVAYGASGIVQPANEIAAAFCTPYRQTATVKVGRISVHRLVRAPARAPEGTMVDRPFSYGGVVVHSRGVVVDSALVH